MIARLTPKQIRVSAAYLVEGLTQEEIATKYRMSQSAVSKVLSRARQACPRLPKRPPAQTRHNTQISQLTSRSGRSVFAAAGLN